MIGNRIERRTLKEMMRKGQRVAVFTMKGYKESGKIIGFDNKCVVLLNVHDEKKIMYKSAISTIKEDKYVRDKEE